MINVVTIGSSVITTVFADAVRQVDGIQITTTYSRDAARAAEFAEKIGAPASTADLEAVLADPEVHAVYVGSPNAVHAEQVRLALTAGKHVFVEKPAVGSVAEWDDLVERSETAGRVLFEGIRTVYDPGTAAVLELLPSLGTIRRASLHYQNRSSRYSDVLAGKKVNIFDPAMGGGALADLGVYVLHALFYLFGEPTRLQASSVALDAGVDGAGTVLYDYPGFTADVTYSKITNSPRPSEIQGELATLSIDHIASPRTLVRYGIDGTVDEFTVEGQQHSLVGEVARFAELVASGASVRVDNDRTRTALQAIADIRAAAL